MDDQQGNLIDGTARARQWRGSRPKPRAAADRIEQHSDAPRSMASSLLVPPEVPALDVGGIDRATSANTDRRAGEFPAGAAEHVNPFLAQAGSHARTSARSTSRLGHTRGRIVRVAGIALAMLTVLTLGGLILERPGSAPAPLMGGQGANTASSSLGLLKSGPLAATTSPFAAEPAIRRPRARRATTAPRRRTPAVGALSRSVRFVVHRESTTHRPSSATPMSQEPATQPQESSAVSRPTSSSQAPAQQQGSESATAASSNSTTNRPAFGSEGLLGPGSSPTG